jgi:hypothetical protein
MGRAASAERPHLTAGNAERGGAGGDRIMRVANVLRHDLEAAIRAAWALDTCDPADVDDWSGRISAGSRRLSVATIFSLAASQGGIPCTATATPRRPFEPSSKRRRGFPLASPASSAVIASSASTQSLSKNSGGTILAHVDPVAAFRKCCRRTGRFDGAPASYYVRDRRL